MALGLEEQNEPSNCSHVQLISVFFEVQACGLYTGGARGEQLRDERYQVHCLAGSASQLSDLIKQEQFHIVHVHEPGDPGLLQIIRQSGVPLLVETSVFGRPRSAPFDALADLTLHICKSNAVRLWKWNRLDSEWFRQRYWVGSHM